MSICANTIDNGVGSAGKPILEVYIAGGMTNADVGTPEYVQGSLYCINGATGAVIWHIIDEDIFAQTKMELADVNNDGKLELYYTDYRGSQLVNAATGEEIWERSWTNYGETPAINGLRLDKQTVIIRDPNNQIYVYQRAMGGYMYKRIASTGALVSTSTWTGSPCFGGSAAADMNGDGVPEIVEDSGGTYCMDLNMVKIWQDTTVMGGNTGAVPVLVDCNNDGWLDVVVMSASSSSCRIGVINGKSSWENRFGVGNGNAVWLKPMTSTGYSGHNAPAVYDIDGDGNLEAGFSWSDEGVSKGCIWDLGTMTKESWSPELADGYSCTFANVWGDSNYLEIASGPYCNVWDHTGVLVSSKNRYGSSPILVADVDGDGINEAISDGSCIVTVPASPFGGTTIWSWGWNFCWDTGVPSLNPRQEVLSQLYGTRRTGAELPITPYLWAGTQPPIPVITVTSPNGGESLQLNNQHEITWSSSDVTGNVYIQLYKGETRISSIETANDGAFLWSLESLIPGNDYKIKITNLEGNVFDFSNTPFTIIEISQPSITVISPNGGESWQTGSIHDINWITKNLVGDVKIELYKGDSLSLLIDTTSHNFSWTVPTIDTGDDYRIKISSLTTSDFSDTSFSIVAPPNPTEVRCWRCEGNTSSFYDFSSGTVCGEGNAVYFPYSTEPTCIGPSVPGFELIFIIIAIGIGLIIRRKKI
jgi:hypothetical protein